MIESNKIEIRLMTDEDVGAALRLKEIAGWNQTQVDWLRLLKLEPHGCFVALIDGKIVATTTTITYAKALAWIGMVLVDPKYRRRGIATQIVRAALERLHDKESATVKLDATPQGLAVYEALGFETELVIERWMGAANQALESDCLAMAATDFSEVCELDRRAFGADRSTLLKALIEEASVAPLVSRATDGSLQGYVLARHGTNASYIGPLVATNNAVASALLDGALNQMSGRQIYVDVNTTFEGGTRALSQRDFVKQRDLIRMSLGKKSEAGTSALVFAIAGPEIG